MGKICFLNGRISQHQHLYIQHKASLVVNRGILLCRFKNVMVYFQDVFKEIVVINVILNRESKRL